MSRVLLGTPDLDLSERFRSALGELAGHELLGVVTSSGETVATLAGCDPEVLVLSEELGPVPVLDLVRQIARSHPFTAVVLVPVRDDTETVRQAMEAGVRALLSPTFTVADVEARLDTAGTWAGTVRQHVAGESALQVGTGRVLAVTGGKGGVGTTTLAVHLALQAVAAGRRTCLVDLDLQTGDVASLLDVQTGRDVLDLVDVASDITGRALDDVLYRHPSGMRVLFAPRDGERGEEVSASVARAILGALTSHFEVIVVDCGAVLGPAGACAVGLAEQVLVVTTPDIPAVLGARRQMRLCSRLGVRSEEDNTVVLNRVSRSVEVQPDLVQQMLHSTKAPLVVPAGFRAFEAWVNTGDPQRLVDRDMRRALAALGEHVGLQDAVHSVAEAPGRMSRLRRREAGQVAVETLGAFLFIAVICLALLQGALIGLSHVFAGHAAFRAARVAVVPDSGPGEIVAAGLRELPSGWRSGATVDTVDPRTDPAAPVVVTVHTPQVVPMIGRLFGDQLTVTSRAALHYEGKT